MSTVYITGHRNPDMDSVCSAWAYARLKNAIDSSNTYVPVRCGHLSSSVKKQFALLETEPPVYLRDVSPKVKDVMLDIREKLELSGPIYDLIRVYDPAKPSAYPVYDSGRFYGLLSIDDINAWFLSESAAERPVYSFTEENITRVVDGTVIRHGKEPSFHGSVITGACTENFFLNCSQHDAKPLVVMSCNKEYVRNAIEYQAPAIVLAGCKEIPDLPDCSGYSGTIIMTPHDTAEAIRRVRLAPAISTIIQKQGPVLQTSILFDEARDTLMDSNLRGLSVFDGDAFVGFVTRRCFLKKPRFDVILVDHNEVGQSIRGIEEASVREIIDHHRLDALKTDLPIFIDSEPLGSTCTIVYSQYQRHNIVPDQMTAKILLAGILSDTLILRSPTTTAVDKAAAGALAAICGEYDINAFGEKMFSVTENLSGMDPEVAITSDFKVYSESGMKFGIGQYETTTLSNLNDYAGTYLDTLAHVAKTSGLDWAMLMITDVLREKSVLLVTDSRLNRRLPYKQISKNVYDMPGVLSRKKQLLPEILHTMD